MIYDPILAERLASLPTEKFSGEVFRVTGQSADPTAPSLTGGRWARPQSDSDLGTSVLYTSLNRDGAMAEVASFLLDLSPVPGPVELKITRLQVTTSKTLRLGRPDLSQLGIDMTCYGERDYPRTQEIGSTAAWLALDGLITPSARWECDNLTIFSDNHTLGEKLEQVSSELVEWRNWAVAHGLLSK
jgi:hypothetical protein